MLLYTRNFKLALSFKQSKLPLFYLITIAIEFIKYIAITRNYSLNYALVFAMGILQWAMCLFAIHAIGLRINQDNNGKIHNTIKTFFALNFLVSFFFLAILIFHPIWLTYWGHGADISFSHPSAGDTILGISFDTSTVNATLNSLGLIYFLYKKEYLFCSINTLTIAFCTSNTTSLFVIGILALMVLTVRQKKLRIATLIFLAFFVISYFAISPKNREYLRNYFVQLYVLNRETKPEIDTNTYHLRVGDSVVTIKNAIKIIPDSAYNYSNKRLENVMSNLVSMKDLHRNDSGYVVIPDEIYERRPGKLISFIQTYYYTKQNLKHFLFGSGIGNFSSKLAFRASGVHALGSYPQRYKYISPDFANDHLRTYLYYFNSDASKHSVLNYPFSVYNQILGEYGFIGTLSFVIFYLGYFLIRYRRLSYGRYLIIVLLGFFLMEYWFEFLSLVVVFELFMLLNIKEGRPQITTAKKETSS